MISVDTHKYGVLQCKPLGVIWANFGGRWSNKNTVMFDDLRRNFVMNPQVRSGGHACVTLSSPDSYEAALRRLRRTILSTMWLPYAKKVL